MMKKQEFFNPAYKKMIDRLSFRTESKPPYIIPVKHFVQNMPCQEKILALILSSICYKIFEL